MWFVVAASLFLPPQYMKIVRVEASRHGLDPLLVAAVIYKESRFSNGVCYLGSHGLMQIQLRPRFCVGSLLKAQFLGLYNPAVNIRRGVRLLKWWRTWWEKHHAQKSFHWLLFYNQGFGKCPGKKRYCAKVDRIPIRTGKIGGYADRVLKIYEELKRKQKR